MAEAVQLPDGLDDCAVYLRLRPGEFDFAGFIGTVEVSEMYAIRPDKRAFFAALQADGVVNRAHAHIDGVLEGNDKEQGAVRLELALVPGRHEQGDAELPQLVDAIRLIRDHLKDPDVVFRCHITANFSLNSDDWITIVPLPVTTIATQLPGSPQIVGVDFAFQGEDKDQPIRRAFVTTYEPTKRLVIRMLLAAQAGCNLELASVATSMAKQHLPTFARRRSDVVEG